MKNYKEKRIQLPILKSSDFFLRKQSNFLRNRFTSQWENFLSMYKYSKKKKPFDFNSMYFGISKEQDTNKTFPIVTSTGVIETKICRERLHTNRTIFFSFKKKELSNYNYLILAKLVNFLGNHKIIKNKIRMLLKIYGQRLQVEKKFPIKLIKNSVFFSWIVYLCMEKLSHFLKMTYSFLNSFKLLFSSHPLWRKKTKFEIRNTENFLFGTSPDLALLEWYQNQINKWLYKVFVKTKENLKNQNTSNLTVPCSSNRIVPGIDKTFGYYQQTEITNKIKTVVQWPVGPWRIPDGTKNNNFYGNSHHLESMVASQKRPFISSGMRRMKGSKKKYLWLFKDILLKSKVNNQVKLIHKLNKIIRSWDTFVVNNIAKRNTIKANLFLYQLLWRWGLARHKTKKAKWIKNRYWSINLLAPSRVSSRQEPNLYKLYKR